MDCVLGPCSIVLMYQSSWLVQVRVPNSKWVDIEFHGLVDNIWLYYFTLVQLGHNKQENNKQIVCSLEENIL